MNGRAVIGMIDNEVKLNMDLCKRFPFLLPYSAFKESADDDLLPRTDCVDSDFDYSYTMLDFVPKGWEPLFMKMCEDIRMAIEGTAEYHTFRFIDIKEKYGMLRMAATGGNEKTDSLIDQCEKTSKGVCVNCGKPATRVSKGWICPYCDDCIGDMPSAEFLHSEE